MYIKHVSDVTDDAAIFQLYCLFLERKTFAALSLSVFDCRFFFSKAFFSKYLSYSLTKKHK